MAIQMQIRRGTLAAWAAASSPVLLPGELGFVTDVGKTAFKIGNTAGDGWNDLPYVNSTYPELDVSAGSNLNTSLAQGRYPLLTGTTYTNIPTDFGGTTTDGNSILLVTVPTNSIVIQELTTSLTSCKRWIRAYTGTWTAWKRIDTLSATESLSITNLTLTGTLTLDDGAVGTPSLTFTGDTNTGVYSTGADNLSITTNGVQRVAVGTALTTVTTPLTVSGLVTANAGSGVPALTVAAGTTLLKYTQVDGILKVPNSTSSRIVFGDTATATLSSYNFYFDSSPYLTARAKTSGGTTTDAEFLWGGYNRLGSLVTTIRTDGVPTNTTDLTTKSYVDTAVAGVTFREIMFIAMASEPTDGNYTVGGTIVTGVIAGSTAVRLLLTGSGAPTFTYVSNNASSTVTWTTFTSGGRYHLVPSAGTWAVACPIGGFGVVFQAIRTA